MIRKIVSYPVWVGPFKAYKAMARIEKELAALPGYAELNREHKRHFMTVLVWWLGLAPVVFVALHYILKAMGFGS